MRECVCVSRPSPSCPFLPRTRGKLWRPEKRGGLGGDRWAIDWGRLAVMEGRSVGGAAAATMLVVSFDSLVLYLEGERGRGRETEHGEGGSAREVMAGWADGMGWMDSAPR